jgi:hypothetical protein
MAENQPQHGDGIEQTVQDDRPDQALSPVTEITEHDAQNK